MTVTFTIDRDGYTNSIQMSIGNESHGYRLAGPKYLGASTTLLAIPVDAGMAAEIRDRITRLGSDGERVVVVAEEAIDGGGVRLSIGAESDLLILAGHGIAGEFRPLRRGVLDGRDTAEVSAYLAEAIGAVA